MTGLLDEAAEAHGGFRRRREVRSIKVAASVAGAIWFVNSKGDALKDVVLTAATRTEHLVVGFPDHFKSHTRARVYSILVILASKMKYARIFNRGERHWSMVASEATSLTTHQGVFRDECHSEIKPCSRGQRTGTSSRIESEPPSAGAGRGRR